MQTGSGPRFYHPELDGLRFIAFLLVFIHNSPYLESSKIWKVLNEYGWIGVDLFFCLSAFLITKLLLAENQLTGKINIRNFYFRRILRILPLYLLYIAIALYFSIQRQPENNNVNWHLAGILTFTFNFVYLFLTPNILLLFVHLWTISYEEQFYTTIPWLLKWLVNKNNKSKWMTFAFLFTLGSSIRALFIYLQIEHPAIYMLPFTHFESILLGISIGFGLFDQILKQVQGWILFIIGILGNIVVFFLPNNYKITWSLMLTYPIVGLGMSLVIFSAIKDEYNFSPGFLKNKLVAYLGKISYGLYMWHIMVNFLIGRYFERQTELFAISIFITGLFITILMATASYHLYERYFLKLKSRFSAIKSHLM